MLFKNHYLIWKILGLLLKCREIVGMLKSIALFLFAKTDSSFVSKNAQSLINLKVITRRKQARLRSANMLRRHGQAEQCMFGFLYTMYYPIGLFIEFRNPISAQSSLFKKSKYFEDRQTDRQT